MPLPRTPAIRKLTFLPFFQLRCKETMDVIVVAVNLPPGTYPVPGVREVGEQWEKQRAKNAGKSARRGKVSRTKPLSPFFAPD